MTYEEFLVVWDRALEQSRLPPHAGNSQQLDLRNLDRLYEVAVEPLSGQDAKPFHVTALLSWRWSVLQTARTVTSEEGFLYEIHGRPSKSDKPWLRIDVKLRATLPFEAPLPMPPPAAWKKWMHEATERLSHIEPVVPKKMTGRQRGGAFEILAWQGEPEVEALCSPAGSLRLTSVSAHSWQALTLPRSGHEKDPSPSDPLKKLFSRLKASLHAWSEVVELLV